MDYKVVFIAAIIGVTIGITGYERRSEKADRLSEWPTRQYSRLWKKAL